MSLKQAQSELLASGYGAQFYVVPERPVCYQVPQHTRAPNNPREEHEKLPIDENGPCHSHIEERHYDSLNFIHAKETHTYWDLADHEKSEEIHSIKNDLNPLDCSNPDSSSGDDDPHGELEDDITLKDVTEFATDNQQNAAQVITLCPGVTKNVTEFLRNCQHVITQKQPTMAIKREEAESDEESIEEAEEVATTEPQSTAQPVTLCENVTQTMARKLGNYTTVTTFTTSAPSSLALELQLRQQSPPQQHIAVDKRNVEMTET